MTQETMFKLDELISNLDDTFSDVGNFEREGFRDIMCSNEVDYDVDDLLITDAGRPNYENMRYIEKNSNYMIHPEEQDAFGWLIGCIEQVKHSTTERRRCMVFG